MVGLIDIPWIGVKIQWHQKALSDSHSTFSPHRISCSYRNGLFAPIHWIWDKPSLIPSLLASVSRMNLLTPASTCEYVKRGAEHSHGFKCLKTDWTTGGHSFSPLVSEMVKWRHNRNMTREELAIVAGPRKLRTYVEWESMGQLVMVSALSIYVVMRKPKNSTNS